MTRAELYPHHLKNVSRSFAFCIERLNSPFREWVSLAYILCRLVDTVEDSPWPDPKLQETSFEKFESFIKSNPNETEVKDWASAFSPDLVEGEKELLKDSNHFFNDLHGLPVNVKNIMVRTVLDMKHGMAHFTKNRKGIRLNNLTEANQYCFFVAGIIGEMLSELFEICEPKYRFDDKQLINSYRFGFFLQKINLLKDQLGDEPQGRFLVPDREQMRQSLVLEGEGAINYILAIPVERKDYRIFCAWSLFLGFASLPYIDRSWAEKKLQKIPRPKTLVLIAKVELIINSNDKLRKLYDELIANHFPAKNFNQPQRAAAKEDIWLYNYYHGRLTANQMGELGLI